MKKLLLMFIFISSLSAVSAQQEKLVNQSIIDMVKIGFTEEVIIAKIQTSECDFNTAIDSLKMLKEKGVGSDIIVAIMKAAKVSQENEEMANDELSGIFIKKEEKLIRIHPTAFSGRKTNTLGAAFSYGLATSKIRSTMLGATSNNIIETTLPEFYFFFERNRNDTSLSNWWFSIATSPNQFVLTELKVKNKQRELETGKVNIYAGSSVGVNENSVIKFRIEEIDEHEYKVIPETPLVPGGEYCFFYQGRIPQGGYSNQAVFDFSISKDIRSFNKYSVGSYVFVIDGDKIKKCQIIDVIVKDGEVCYIGETNLFKKIEWKESNCSLEKKELKSRLPAE